MEMDWLIALIGMILVFIIITDIILTVLHLDTDGPIARFTFYVTWRIGMIIGRLIPSIRRNVVAIAGPMMIVATIAIWIGWFILGFALIYWPFLDYFYFVEEHTTRGFVHALYFSGVTATVLGYGDLAPLSGTLQVISFVQSGLGFALLTGIITYLINIVSGVSDRNALALRLWAETGRTGDGTTAVIRSLASEEVGDLRLRLQTLLVSMHDIHQKMHQFPILDLFYRSKNPIYSPEFMIRSSAQIAIVTLILSADSNYKRIKAVAEELDEVSVELMIIIAKLYMSKMVLSQLKNPQSVDEDEHEYNEKYLNIKKNFPGLDLSDHQENKKALILICRLRIFLDEADRLTGWRMDK